MSATSTLRAPLGAESVLARFGTAVRARAWMIAAIVSVAALGAFILWMGPTAVAAAPWDIFIQLDAGWRMLNGHVPNTDFYSPVGPLVYWLTELGMRIDGPSLRACMWANLIVLAASAPVTIFVFFRKFAPPLAFLLVLAFAVLAVATRPLGYEPEHMSYLMPYNRMGWIIFAILCAHLFMQDREERVARPGLAAFATGALIGLLFLDKITFALGGAAVFAFALILYPSVRAKAWCALPGFAGICIAGWVAFGFDIPAYIADLRMAAASQGLEHRWECMKRVIKFNALQGLALIAAWAALVAQPWRRGIISFAEAAQTTLIVGFVFGLSLVMSIFNTTELTDVPHYLVAAMLVESWLRRGRAARTRVAWAAALLAIVALSTAFPRDLLGMANSYNARAYRDGGAPASQLFESRTYAGFVIEHTTPKEAAYSPARDVPAQINDGLALLRAHVEPTSRLVSLTLANPFTMAMELPPARGAPLWMDLHLDFSHDTAPAPERMFAEADFVIHPRLDTAMAGCCLESVNAMLAANGPYLERRFVEVGRSEHWVLLARREPLPH